jgi:sugar phosphate isomerase/epimerase
MNEYPHIEDAIAKMKELGFRGFDLAAFEGWQNVNPSMLAEAGESWSKEFAHIVKESDMRVSSFNCGISKQLNDDNPDSFAQYKKEYIALLNLAEVVNCPNITVQPGRVSENDSFEKAFNTSMKHLSELSELNKERNVTLSLEGHQGSILENPKDALRMMKSLWPSVGFTYDPSHFTMQGISLKETEPLLDYTMHVHVRNASLGKMQDTMADGIVDFHWLISALTARSYDGAVAIEYFSGFDKEFKNTIALRELLLKLDVEA